MNEYEAATQLIKSLVEINSMNPDLSDPTRTENELAKYINNYLDELGMQTSLQDIEGRLNVVGILQGQGGGRSLIINGHTDTVGYEGMEEPTVAKERDGKIYGRGAFDMKGGIAASLLAIKSIVDGNYTLRGDVIFAGVIDEEYASLGTQALLDSYNADAGIICEPTKERIVIANKGFGWIKIEIFGKAAHGSKPHEGIDAIAKAHKVMQRVYDLNREFKQQVHPLVGSPEIRIAKINGGEGLSTVADRCTIHIERRTLPNVLEQDVISEIEHLLDTITKEDSDFDASYELLIFRSGLELSKNERIVETLSQSFEKVMQQTPIFDGEPWWMDSALMADHGIPTVVIGPKGDGAHAKEEHVEISSVVNLAKVLQETIVTFCQ